MSSHAQRCVSCRDEELAQPLDPLGIVAQLTGISMMGTAIVLVKKWGRPEGTSIFAFAGWQMTAGGIMLLPLALSLEGLPNPMTATLAGFVVLGQALTGGQVLGCQRYRPGDPPTLG